MRFSPSFLVVPILALLSGCAYVIPPEQNAPRNNEVRGDVRRPQLNSVRPQSALPPELMTAPPMQSAAASVPVMPAVDPQVQAAANAQLAAAPVVKTTPTAPRRVPVENQAFQVASMGYDPITNVPPRPAMSGPESVHDQMKATQSDLEKSRDNASTARDTLARDAAAEPSMLSDLPAVKPAAGAKQAPLKPLSPMPEMPAAPSVTVKPAAPANAPVSPSSQVAPAQGAAQLVRVDPPAALPASPEFAPPEPLGAIPPVRATNVAMAPKPMGDFDPLAAANRPLPAPRNVIGQAAKSDEPTITTASLAAPAPAPIRGDFDPLAAANNAPVAVPATGRATTASRPAQGGFLAPSRYYTRRY